MPKTNVVIARKLARINFDDSSFLTHLVRQNEGRSDWQAQNILRRILDVASKWPRPCLEASSTGWYGSERTEEVTVFNPATFGFDSLNQSQAVCFTEGSLRDLKPHRDVFRAKYGLSFDRDFLLQRGATPCLNISKDFLYKDILLPKEHYPRHLYNFIPEPLLPFVNIINGNFDFTHEREWRYPGNLRFRYDNVRFIFCPKDDFPEFYDVQENGLPELFDLAWLDNI